MENKTEYIEIAKFKLKEGFNDEQFIEAEQKVRNGEIKSAKGYLGRELFKAENNEWIIILRFDTKKNMEAFLASLKKELPESLKTYASAIDFSSMRMEFFHKIL
ncbi:MAG: antibiotic biosynthesis monooxygenase [Chloroflexota bacterium]